MDRFARFDTHNGDSQWNERTGQRVEILRELTEAEADISDVGPMFHIRFEDGVETDAFEDELTELMPATSGETKGEKNMIKVIDGNLLDAKTDIIAHQTNCLGIMGGGVALAIRQKYPKVYEQYHEVCAERQGWLWLGKCQVVPTESNTEPHFVANLFGQGGIGKGATDYEALRGAMLSLLDFMYHNGYSSVAMPYLIGCGLAGGDWNTVYSIIQDVFEKTHISVELWRL